MLEHATRGPGRSGGGWLVSKAIDAVSQLLVTPALGVKFDDAEVLERAVRLAPGFRDADDVWKVSPRRQQMFTCYVADSERWLLDAIDRLGDDPSRHGHVAIYPPHQSQKNPRKKTTESEEDACLRGLSYPKTVTPAKFDPNLWRTIGMEIMFYRMIIGVWCFPEFAFQMTLQAVGLLCGLWSGWGWAGLLGKRQVLCRAAGALSGAKPAPWDDMLHLQHGDDEQGDVVQLDTSQSEDDDDADDDLSNFDEADPDLLLPWLGPRQPDMFKGHPLLVPWLGPPTPEMPSSSARGVGAPPSLADAALCVEGASPCVAAASPCVADAHELVCAASPCVASPCVASPCAAHASPMASFVNLALLVSPPSRKRLSSKTTVMVAAALGGTQVVAPAPPLCSSAKPRRSPGAADWSTYARLQQGLQCSPGKRTRLTSADIVRNTKGSLVSKRKSDIGKRAKSAPHFGSFAAAREAVRNASGFGNSVIGGKTARGKEFYRLTLLERNRMLAVGNSAD